MDGPLYGRFLFSSRAFFSEEGFSRLFVCLAGWLAGWMGYSSLGFCDFVGKEKEMKMLVDWSLID
jgi:hypothetical protein